MHEARLQAASIAGNVAIAAIRRGCNGVTVHCYHRSRKDLVKKRPALSNPPARLSQSVQVFLGAASARDAVPLHVGDDLNRAA